MTGYVLPVDKPEGPTSHDIVARARRALGTRRIGHTGTLDPFASGLLLLCVGPATRLAEYLSGLGKEYEAEALLGATTDTLDRDGTVLETRGGWEELDEAAVEAALEPLRGTIDQVPPQFSAKKVEGVRMHERARKGEAVDLPPCRVTIHELRLLSVSLPHVRFRVRCSRGTYVRALARDLGEALGVGAHLTALRRTGIGSFDVATALPPEALTDAAAVEGARVRPLDALGHLPRVEADRRAVERLSHGQRVPIGELDAEAEGLVAVAGEGRLVAIGEITEGVLRPRKVFAA